MYIPWLMTVAGANTSGMVADLLTDTRVALGSGLMLVAIFGWLIVFWFIRGSLRGAVAVDLVVALTSLLLGLGFTVHSFTPNACSGVRLALPFHAVWHFFSSVTMNRAGRILDCLLQYAHSHELARSLSLLREQNKES